MTLISFEVKWVQQKSTYQLISKDKRILEMQKELRKSNLCDRKLKEKTKKYSTIDYKTRKTLIRKVLKEGHRLTKASKELGIKLSTSKFIIRCYRKDGRIFKKKTTVNDTESSLQLQPEDAPIQIQPETANNANVTIIYYPVYVYIPVSCLGSGTDISSQMSFEPLSSDRISTGF